MSASRVWELEELIRDLDPEALTLPDRRGGAAFIYHHAGNRYRLTLTAPSIIRNTLEQSGAAAPLPEGFPVPVWAIRSRDAKADA